MTDRSEELERAAFHDELAKNDQMSISSEQIQTGLQSLQLSTDSLGERMKTMLQVKTEREAHLVSHFSLLFCDLYFFPMSSN